MNRSKGREPGEHRGSKQDEPSGRRAGQPETEREAQDWARETGYRPSANQGRDEPLPASHHADHGQEAVLRNEQNTDTPVRRARSRRGRRRD
jgi:hypothetical protein